MSFITFIFVGIVWMSNGSVQPPIAKAEVSMERCIKDMIDFSTDIALQNSNNPFPLRMTYSATCTPTMNTSESRKS